MKKYFLTLLLLPCMLLMAADGEFQAVLEPATVLEGEPFVLQLINHGKELPQLVKMPENFTYQGSSQSTRIVNGDYTVLAGYRFLAPAPGEYKIPPLPVKLGKKTVNTPELILKVAKDSSVSVGLDDVFARGVFAGKRTAYYVGEDIPLSVNIYYPQKLRIEPTAYPKLDIGKSVFRDFRSVNPENPSFSRAQIKREIVDDKLFNAVIFPTSFRPLAPGKLVVKGSVDCNILIPERRRSNDPFDDFFGGGTAYRRIGRKLMIEMPEITVKPLPPTPQEGFFLGLTGDFTGRVSLSQASVNALEPVSLDVVLQAGNGASFETLQAPEITLPDCRVYPGEVRLDNNKCFISYAVVPLKAGNVDIREDFYFFDPQKEKYQSISIDRTLQVRPSVGKSVTATTTAVPEAGNIASAAGASESAKLPRTTLLYCKKAPSGALRLWFMRNQPLAAWILFISGPLIFLIVRLVRRYRDRHVGDPDAERRERAGAMRNTLAEKVRKCDDGDLPQLITGEVANFFSDRWKLPAGSTMEDIAAASADKELAKALEECANVSYLPPELAKNALGDSERIRRTVINAIKTMALFLILGAGMSTAAAEVKKIPENWHDALKAYDRGDYSQARAYFEKYHQENPADPNVLYNLGCIAEANGEQEMALWYLESAGLLDPLDSAIYQNRNVMRGKFFLPMTDAASTPRELLDALRDRLCPGDYLVIAAVCWFIFFILLIFRRKLPESVWLGCGGGLAAVMLLALIMMFSGCQTSYRKDQALVVTKNAEIFSFPGKHNGKKIGSLAGGTPVTVIESESDYSLVRSGKLEGWTPNQNIRKLAIR